MKLSDKQAHLLLIVLQDTLGTIELTGPGEHHLSREDRHKLFEAIISQQSAEPVERESKPDEAPDFGRVCRFCGQHIVFKQWPGESSYWAIPTDGGSFEYHCSQGGRHEP
jgi:hypothetical protein